MRNLRWQARASARAPRLGYYAGGISLPATNDAFGVTAYLETQAVRAGNETSSTSKSRDRRPFHLSLRSGSALMAPYRLRASFMSADAH
jgi:hypothetical protein